MTYPLKCVATNILSRDAPVLLPEKKLEQACGGRGPPQCPRGSIQIAPLYAEAAGAFQTGFESRIAYNIVRTCDRAPLSSESK